MRNDHWLKSVLDEMRLDSVSSTLYRCAKNWVMHERVISDDMFFYVLKGCGQMTVEDRVHPLRPGVCAHFRRRARHSASHDPKNPIHVITVHYNATIMQSLTLAELLGFPDYFTIGGDGFLNNHFRQMVKEAKGDLLGSNLGLESLLTQVLLHLVRTEVHLKKLKLDYHETRHNDLLRLRPILDHMANTLTDPESMETLARMAGFSVAQFRRVFSRSLRLSPVHYLRRLRIRQACHLLRNTSQTIEEIATQVGYQEASFFARTFKDFMKISPGQYRHQSEL